jgi:SAM-dependent methyltransferase
LSALYIHTENVHNLTAPREVAPLIMELIAPSSILDVGCGIGTWLKAFELLGVTDYCGVDGSYVNRDLLQIPQSKFHPQDLRQEWNLNRQFDLVISLEVAEHLDEQFAGHFVNTLIKHGGQNHVNEQWLSFWKDKFDSVGYTLYDVLRPVIWTNSKVDVWYKQNMVVFCKEGHPLNAKLKPLSSGYVDVVHPDLFSFYRYQAERAELYEQGQLGLKLAFNALVKALTKRLR